MVDDIAAIGKCGADSVELNAIVNAKVRSKFLEFGTNKCFSLHVGKNNHQCSELFAQDSKLKKVTEVKYLGNIISEDGNNNKNIEDRWKKGMGIISSVTAILNEVSLGKHYFNIGLLFRETNIINGILTCAEVWNNVTQNQIERLESVDETYLRSLFGAPATTTKEALYIETGKLPIRFIVSMRRLMYWWHLTKEDKSSMLFKFYSAQESKAVKGDWMKLLEKDKKDLGIELSDDELFEEYKTKYSIKKYLDKKVKIAAQQCLYNRKIQHTKLDNIVFTELKCEKYLLDGRFTKREEKLLFKLRTRKYFVKSNYKKMYNFNLFCELCKSQICDQQHLLQCSD